MATTRKAPTSDNMDDSVSDELSQPADEVVAPDGSTALPAPDAIEQVDLDDKEAVAKAKRDAYAASLKQLRLAHLPEFNESQQQYLKERGIFWTAPPTAQERKIEQARRLLAEAGFEDVEIPGVS